VSSARTPPPAANSSASSSNSRHKKTGVHRRFFFVRKKSGKLRAFHSHREAFNVFVKALRVGLGQLIIFIDFITRPGKKNRPAAAQAQVESAAKGLTLYQFHACPFCVKTRRTLRRLNVPVALRDAKNNEQDRQTLLEQGGKIKVPCLRIEENGQTTWMYESKVIIDYLDKRFAAA
jgi:glutaredoxin